jgi:predicted nucleic acid-binding protein
MGKRPDKRYSLTDCISFVFMEQRAIREAPAFNRHFEQAGFAAMPRR